MICQGIAQKKSLIGKEADRKENKEIPGNKNAGC
jgi:hypothetical protein